MPENTISVTRPGEFGNPFKIGRYFMIGDPDGNRHGIFRMTYCQSLEAPEIALRKGFTLIKSAAHAVEWYRRYRSIVPLRPEEVAQLRGKNLACFCPLFDKDGNRVPCHADVLLELANK